MAFRFKNASCVVAGTFNMYIVQPPWLVKMGIIPNGVPIAIASKMDQPGFRYILHKMVSRWFVTPSKIEVETEKPGEDCGESVAKVLAALPMTPLKAIGNNAIYNAPLEDLQYLPEVAQYTAQMPSGYELAQRSLHLGLAQGGRIFNLQLSISKEELELCANVHTELEGRDSEYAQAAARRYFQDRKDAEELIRHLFNASIDHAERNGQPAQTLNGAEKQGDS